MIEPGVTILGGGVVGLSIARELAGRGMAVVLLEARHVGAGASTAAVGVLSAPATKRSALAALSRAGYEMYPELALALREETGVDIGYRECGCLTLCDALPPDPEAEIDAWRRAGVGASWVGRREIEEAIPGYRGPFTDALRLDREAAVDPSSLVRGLRLSCEKRGVEILEGAGDVEIRRSPRAAGRVVVRRAGAADGDDDGDVGIANGAEKNDDAGVVLAAGAWSERITASLEPGRVRVAPIRGQALELDHPPPRQIVHFRPPGAEKTYYLVPRPGGWTWVGSTVEDAGFEAVVTEAGREEILSAARCVLGEVSERSVARIWAGLRPKALRRGGPFLGPWPGIENLWVACGHYRSGILQGPASARLLVDALIDGRPIPRAFSL